MAALIECVPNFSEGQDASVIKAITDAIEAVLAEGADLTRDLGGAATTQQLGKTIADVL